EPQRAREVVLLHVHQADHLVEDRRAQLFAEPIEDPPGTSSQAQGLSGAAEATQAVDGAGVAARCIAGSSKAAIHLARMGIVHQSCLVLAEKPPRFATDLTRVCSLGQITTGIGECDRLVSGVQRPTGVADQVTPRSLKQLVEADPAPPERRGAGESRQTKARRRSARSPVRENEAKRRSAHARGWAAQTRRLPRAWSEQRAEHGLATGAAGRLAGPRRSQCRQCGPQWRAPGRER